MTFTTYRSPESSLILVRKLSRICSYSGPLSNQLYNLVRDERWLDVIDFSIDYTWAFSADDFLSARQIKAFLEKQDYIDLGVDRELSAFQNFLESEASCKNANRRIDNLASLDWDVMGVVDIAVNIISKTIGFVPPALSTLDLFYGPGATTSTNSFIACARTKLDSRLECSLNLAPLLGELLEQLPHLAMYHRSSNSMSRDLLAYLEGFELLNIQVPVNFAAGKLSFVEKNCKSHRGIVVEPILNGLIQKGIGSRLKSLCRRAGLNLSDQTINMRLAQQGSITNEICTIDLKNASDTVCRSLIWLLFPPQWAELLDSCRSECVTYLREGEPAKRRKHFRLEKFSSMGNSFTFELESLIFWSLSKACCKYLKIDGKHVNTYGDDIIIPVKAYDLMEKVLVELGFTLNVKKSFKTGPFRESCGGDYFLGLDIRPFYLRTKVNVQNLYVMHNFFYRNLQFKLAEAVMEEIPVVDRLFGPDGYGDGHLLGEFTLDPLVRKERRRGYAGGSFITWQAIPNEYKTHCDSDRMYPSYVASQYPKNVSASQIINDLMRPRPEDNPYAVRGTAGYQKVSIYTFADTIFASNRSYKPKPYDILIGTDL